ncbi:MAG TPA: hypothetical protein VJJ23_00460 [Candidatus Nanoarchaeia archaeon]|nr:hypothetical protein [Candidatus Nanoarchaeia archaeon]
MVDYAAVVYIGAMLKKDKIMETFGARYGEKIRDICKKDNVPNTEGKKFCSECGSNLKYKEKISDGIESFSDLENLPILGENGLEVIILNNEVNGVDGAVVGKRIVNTIYLSEEGGKVEEIKPYEDILKLKEKLSIVGIPDPVKMYLVTDVN